MPPRRKKKYTSRPKKAAELSVEPSTQAPASSQSWGRLINDNWEASPLYNRLVDALFDFLDSTASLPLTNTGQLEFEKWDTLQKMTEADGWENVPHAVAGRMMHAAWDHLGVMYTMTEDDDGNKFPTLNKENFRLAELEGSKVDPDKECQEWTERLAAVTLIDPSTNTQFIGPIPRSAFPEEAVPGAREAFDNMVKDAVAAIAQPHTRDHIEFYALTTNSGAVFCNVCNKPIVGHRYKCKNCFNYNECEDCFITVVPQPGPEAVQ